VGGTETPLILQVGGTETPLNLQVGGTETPLILQVGGTETPLILQVGGTETPLNLHPGFWFWSDDHRVAMQSGSLLTYTSATIETVTYIMSKTTFITEAYGGKYLSNLVHVQYFETCVYMWPC
jgi:hypothetical protein